MALTPEQLADIRTRIPARPHSDVPTPYEDLVRRIMLEGTLKSDRTGTGTISLFGQQMRFDLSEGFPLLTTKTVFFKGLAYELLWFLKGSSNVRWLQEHNVHIWDDWADENGDLGPVYGVQWRSWPAPTPEDPNRTIDQIGNVLDLIRNHPDSRRMVVSAWNPAEVENMALPPCHALFQFYVADGRLSCQLYQRSCDMFIGVPFNIASYSLLTMMIAQQAGLEPGEFVWTGGDCHVYDNHVDQFLEQLGNKKSPIIVAALNRYLEDNPGLLDGRVRIQVHVSDLNTRMLEDKIRQLIEERLTSSVPLPTQAAANPRENVEQVSADILEMLNDLDSFG